MRLGFAFFALNALGMTPVYILPVTRDEESGYFYATSAYFVLFVAAALIALGWFIAGWMAKRTAPR